MAENAGIWVYAVAGAARWDDLTGLAEQPVHSVKAAGLAAAVSTVSLDEFGEEALRAHLEDLAWLEATARMHHQVIEKVAAGGPAVPLRLATVYSSADKVAALLAERHEDFEVALDRVAGRTEWGVKAHAASLDTGRIEPGADSAPGERGTGAPDARPGAAYLRKRRQELSAVEDAQRTAVSSAEEVHASLTRTAVEAQVRPAQDPQLSGQEGPTILNATYLVDDDRCDEFVAVVRQLADRSIGIRLELTGPWPPYSFAAVPGQEPQGEHD